MAHCYSFLASAAFSGILAVFCDKSYSAIMIFHLSSSVKSSCHTGMAESHGVASFGNPLPPVLTLQNVYPSTIVSMVPLSVKFIEQIKNNAVEFIPQAKMPPGGIDFIPFEPVQTFLKELKEGKTDKEKAKLALREKNLFEGRILYEMNCRPCHGDSVAGDGPMADGFKLRPINFTDNGTIETIVEGYTFWRVSTG